MPAKVRTSNRECDYYVRNLIPFQANHIFSENKGDLYIVYSWGKHFPMYIYSYNTGLWYGNSDRYSQTTSKHQSQASPGQVDVWLSTSEMDTIIDGQVPIKMKPARKKPKPKPRKLNIPEVKPTDMKLDYKLMYDTFTFSNKKRKKEPIDWRYY